MQLLGRTVRTEPGSMRYRAIYLSTACSSSPGKEGVYQQRTVGSVQPALMHFTPKSAKGRVNHSALYPVPPFMESPHQKFWEIFQG